MSSRAPLPAAALAAILLLAPGATAAGGGAASADLEAAILGAPAPAPALSGLTVLSASRDETVALEPADGAGGGMSPVMKLKLTNR